MKLVCKDLKFSYGSKSVIHISSANLTLEKFNWIQGPSGSGKSTWLQLLSGLLAPQSGQIQWGSLELNQMDSGQRQSFLRQHVGFLNQENRLIGHWTLLQNLGLVSNEVQMIQTVLHELKLSPDLWNSRVEILSGGERQRAHLARLFLKKPKIALLDEPTSHLDDSSMGLAMSLMKKYLQEATTLIVSHDSRMSAHVANRLSFEEINR